ncbi:MAG: hypothetical protein DMF84_16330 [Acidobacteria bacterium]|nr:MAG: hypothetical protein DMF84_16330 [Acidobacteriota bacterium]
MTICSSKTSSLRWCFRPRISQTHFVRHRTPAPPRRRRWWWWVYAVTLAASAGLAAAVLWWRWIPERPVPLESNWTANTTVLAGDGVTGAKDGWADEARFSDPFGVAAGPDGTTYVADGGDAQSIRAISPDGDVYTIAGGARGFADGKGSAARFDTPSGVAIDSHGTLFVADTGNNAIRRVASTGEVSTIAGDTVSGYRDGPAPVTGGSSSPTRTTIVSARLTLMGRYGRLRGLNLGSPTAQARPPGFRRRAESSSIPAGTFILQTRATASPGFSTLPATLRPPPSRRVRFPPSASPLGGTAPATSLTNEAVSSSCP